MDYFEYRYRRALKEMAGDLSISGTDIERIASQIREYLSEGGSSGRKPEGTGGVCGPAGVEDVEHPPAG